MLLIRPDHVGDVLLTSPAVELLRKALPEAHITMMVGPWAEDIARRDPFLDEVAVCPFPGFTRAEKRSFWDPYRLLLSVADELRARRYDAALLLRFDHWWGAWLAAAAGVPVRAGIRTSETEPFLNCPVDLAGSAHWVTRSVRVVERLLETWDVKQLAQHVSPALRFDVRKEDEAAADGLWRELGLEPGRAAAAIHPGAGAALKLWPAERWSEAGRRLAEKGATVLVTGSSAEAALADRIAADIPGARSLAGRTGLGVLGAVFKRCRLVAGVDSGPLHLAVAVDTPSLRLYGPTDVAVYGPWGAASRHRSLFAGLPGSPCGRLDLKLIDGESPPCLRALTVDHVCRVSEELLALDAGPRDASQEAE